MKKRTPLTSEGFSENATEADVIQFMTDIKPHSVPPLSPLTRKDGESPQDFDARRIREILVQFYEIPSDIIVSPIEVSAGITRPGVSISFSDRPISLVLSMDYPEALTEMLSSTPGMMGSRLSLMGIQIDSESPESCPNPVKELPTMFTGLPGNVSYAPWQVSPLSNKGIIIYEALVGAPKNLQHHLVADCLARTYEWLHDSHGY